MFCACFSAFHLFNRNLDCIWKFFIESKGVRIDFETEKCSELAASLENFYPRADKSLQWSIDMLQTSHHKEAAPVISGMKQSEKDKLMLSSKGIQEEIEKEVLRIEKY
ncbi:MAG: hypothetical protein ACK55Z_21160 [bacterium]